MCNGIERPFAGIVSWHCYAGSRNAWCSACA